MKRWSRKHESCLLCGSTERPHRARGLCTSCYWKEYRKSVDLDAFVEALKPLSKAQIGIQWDGKHLVLRYFNKILVDYTF